MDKHSRSWSNSKEDPKEALRNALELNPQIHSELVSLPPAEEARLWSLHIDMERVTLVRRSPELSQPAISFDLQAMCDNKERSAFRLLWILTHPSRWHQQLEAWHKEKASRLSICGALRCGHLSEKHAFAEQFSAVSSGQY